MKKSRLLGALSVVLVSIVISPAAVAATVTIDFEGTGAPAFFANTSPLTNLYAPLVFFNGVDGVGGSILNQTASFGVDAHSGTDFLAFNSEIGTGTTELLSFSSSITVNSFEIYAAGGQNPATFLLEAFDAGNNLLANDTITTTDWGLLSVAAPGISNIELTQTGTGTNNTWVYDDIAFNTVNTVPLPAAVWLFGTGLLGLIGMARRKKSA